MLEKLTVIIREYTGDKTLTINPNTILISDLGLNSLDLVNLVCEVEETFDIEIPDRVIKELKTVGDVMAFIQNNWLINKCKNEIL